MVTNPRSPQTLHARTVRQKKIGRQKHSDAGRLLRELETARATVADLETKLAQTVEALERQAALLENLPATQKDFAHVLAGKDVEIADLKKEVASYADALAADRAALADSSEELERWRAAGSTVGLKLAE